MRHAWEAVGLLFESEQPYLFSLFILLALSVCKLQSYCPTDKGRGTWACNDCCRYFQRMIAVGTGPVPGLLAARGDDPIGEGRNGQWFSVWRDVALSNNKTCLSRQFIQFLQQGCNGLREPGIDETGTRGKPFVRNILSRNRYRSITKANPERVLRVWTRSATDIKLYT